jgi:sporulation protein YlmC with PRC-barrel domain
MRLVKLSLAASILVTSGIATAAAEMTRPFEVLEQTRRAMSELDQRQRREGVERQKQQQAQEAKRKREEAEQRKREREEKAQKETQRKREEAEQRTREREKAQQEAQRKRDAAAATAAQGVPTAPSQATTQAPERQPPVQSVPPVRTQVGANPPMASPTAPPATGPADERRPQARPEPAETRAGATQGEGEPDKRVPGGPPPAAGSRATPGHAPAAAAAAGTRAIAVSRLKRMNLYNDRGDKLGDVERVLQSPDGSFHIVIGAGGFLGIRERDVRIPLDRVTMRGDRLMIQGLTDDQVKVMPVFDRKDRTYRDLARNAMVPVVRDPSGK